MTDRNLSEAYRDVDVERVSVTRRERHRDRTATEAPLQILLDGAPFSVTMRTPGADRELVAGFLLAEQVVRSPDDILAIRIAPTSDPARPAAADVSLAPSVRAALPALLADRRQVTQTSACGICGRRSLGSLEADAPAIVETWTLGATEIRSLPIRLREAQVVFAQTGGLHAAALFRRGTTISALYEDVGRHNAVDKVIGRMLLDRQCPLLDYVLFVSGRTSFEILQKAHLAGIPVVAAVSAPSTLAIDLAEDAGITLVGFVRGETFNVYTHGFRIDHHA